MYVILVTKQFSDEDFLHQKLKKFLIIKKKNQPFLLDHKVKLIDITKG